MLLHFTMNIKEEMRQDRLFFNVPSTEITLTLNFMRGGGAFLWQIAAWACLRFF